MTEIKERDNQMLSFEKNNTPEIYFKAELSDGKCVFEDNGSPNSWLRLSDFIKQNPGIKITKLNLFRGNQLICDTPENQKGYVFGKKQIKTWPSQQKCSLIGIGYLDNDNVNIHWLQLPLLNNGYLETRTKDQAGFFLIQNSE